LGVFGALVAEALNGSVYWLAFPALIFLPLSQVPVDRVLDGPLHTAYAGAVFGTFALVIQGLTPSPILLIWGCRCR